MSSANKIGVSFEFFPPQTTDGVEKLRVAREKLAQLSPEFFSVTFGAGGSTRERTRDIVLEIKDEGLENEGLTSTYENDMDLIDILEDIATVLDINYSILEDTILFHMAGN